MSKTLEERVAELERKIENPLQHSMESKAYLRQMSKLFRNIWNLSRSKHGEKIIDEEEK